MYLRQQPHVGLGLLQVEQPHSREGYEADVNRDRGPDEDFREQPELLDPDSASGVRTEPFQNHAQGGTSGEMLGFNQSLPSIEM